MRQATASPSKHSNLTPTTAIARSGALLLSTLPDWLVSSAADQTTLHAALQLLLASLAFHESEREPFPLKSKQVRGTFSD